MLVIDAGGNGEGGHITLTMVHHCMHIRGKYGLGMVVYSNGRVGPPEERLGEPGWVEELSGNLDICLLGVQGNGGNTLGAIHAVGITKLDAYRIV